MPRQKQWISIGANISVCKGIRNKQRHGRYLQVQAVAPAARGTVHNSFPRSASNC
jgi:hypothetical protein